MPGVALRLELLAIKEGDSFIVLNLFKRKKQKQKQNVSEAVTPEFYTEEEVQRVEEHIKTYFGGYDSVFHEIVSPDIHVDIAIIEPTEQHPYYTLITMGMGAHRMNVPTELSSRKLERAELVICLPSGWKMKTDDETGYWPIRWLKIMARLPGDQNTWLGYGHTVPCGRPVSDDAQFSCMMLSHLVQFDENANVCEMQDGSAINFYQLIPLYEEEMNFKLNNGAEALLEKMAADMKAVVDVNRKNVCL